MRPIPVLLSALFLATGLARGPSASPTTLPFAVPAITLKPTTDPAVICRHLSAELTEIIQVPSPEYGDAQDLLLETARTQHELNDLDGVRQTAAAMQRLANESFLDSPDGQTHHEVHAALALVYAWSGDQRQYDREITDAYELIATGRISPIFACSDVAKAEYEAGDWAGFSRTVGSIRDPANQLSMINAAASVAIKHGWVDRYPKLLAQVPLRPTNPDLRTYEIADLQIMMGEYVAAEKTIHLLNNGRSQGLIDLAAATSDHDMAERALKEAEPLVCEDPPHIFESPRLVAAELIAGRDDAALQIMDAFKHATLPSDRLLRSDYLMRRAAMDLRLGFMADMHDHLLGAQASTASPATARSAMPLAASSIKAFVQACVETRKYEPFDELVALLDAPANRQAAFDECALLRAEADDFEGAQATIARAPEGDDLNVAIEKIIEIEAKSRGLEVLVDWINTFHQRQHQLYAELGLARGLIDKARSPLDTPATTFALTTAPAADSTTRPAFASEGERMELPYYWERRSIREAAAITGDIDHRMLIEDIALRTAGRVKDRVALDAAIARVRPMIDSDLTAEWKIWMYLSIADAEYLVGDTPGENQYLVLAEQTALTAENPPSPASLESIAECKAHVGDFHGALATANLIRSRSRAVLAFCEIADHAREFHEWDNYDAAIANAADSASWLQGNARDDALVTIIESQLLAGDSHHAAENAVRCVTIYHQACAFDMIADHLLTMGNTADYPPWRDAVLARLRAFPDKDQTDLALQLADFEAKHGDMQAALAKLRFMQSRLTDQTPNFIRADLVRDFTLAGDRQTALNLCHNLEQRVNDRRTLSPATRYFDDYDLARALVAVDDVAAASKLIPTLPEQNQKNAVLVLVTKALLSRGDIELAKHIALDISGMSTAWSDLVAPDTKALRLLGLRGWIATLPLPEDRAVAYAEVAWQLADQQSRVNSPATPSAATPRATGASASAAASLGDRFSLSPATAPTR